MNKFLFEYNEYLGSFGVELPGSLWNLQALRIVQISSFVLLNTRIHVINTKTYANMLMK